MDAEVPSLGEFLHAEIEDDLRRSPGTDIRRQPMNVDSPACHCDISVLGLEIAVLSYEEKHGVRPTTVIYGRNSAPTTLAIRYGMRKHALFEAFRYWIEVPDLPGEMWFVCGPEGIYGSPGA